MLESLRNHDAPPLRPERLAAGNAIDIPAQRYRNRWTTLTEVLAAVLVVAAVIGWIVVTP